MWEKPNKATSKRKGPAHTKVKEVGLYSYTQPLLSCQSSTNPKPNLGSYQIASLAFCSPLVRKCHGCSGNFKRPDDSIPEAPHDLVVVTRGDREYFDKSHGCMRVKENCNVYYHIDMACIKKRNPVFIPSLMHVPDDLKPHLSAEHFALLRNINVNCD